VSAVARSWLAFAAVGAGLVHLALVIGSAPASAAVFAVIGVLEFAWGLFTVATGRVAAPRAALVGALVPAAFWVVAIFATSAAHLPQLATSLRVLPLLVATLLELFVAATIAVSLRRSSVSPRATAASSTAASSTAARSTAARSTTGRQLFGIAAGIVVIAALTAPALAATQVGELALPAGTFDDHAGH
jgi:hypothetical protein